MANLKLTPDLMEHLLSSNHSARVRARIFYDLVKGAGKKPEPMLEFMEEFFKFVERPSAEDAKLKALYESVLSELETGPARPATFIAKANGGLPKSLPRVHVITPDGQERFPILHPGLKLRGLEPGVTVYLSANGAMVLGLTRSLPEVGLEAHFLRRLPDSKKVEVTLRDDRLVLHASKEILGAEESGTMKRGAPLLISPTREFAFRCLPTQEDKRYRYVDTEKIPDIEISRDIGKPHWVLGWLIRRMRILLDRPDILERFDLRPRFSVMMTGPTGVGKTLHIKAFLCEFRRMLEKRTGLTDLGSRVIRIKTSDLLSEFLGRSDKQIDELFDDIYQLASEKVESAQGELLVLPIVVVLEEVEALGRRRGAHDGAVYDRIIGTILQRLDDPTDDLGRLPIMLISTSNRPDLADPAILRRLGFLRANFTRLESEDLAAILSKKLKENYLYSPQDGLNEDQIRPHLIDRVVSWFFNSNGSNPGIVEVVLRDGSRIVKHRRDFLSGALVEQAVSNSIDQMAFSMEESGDDRDIGFTAESLIESFRRQVDSLAESLTAWNAADHLDLPEHSLVASVNRLPGLYSRPAAVLAENQWPEQEQKTDQKTMEEIHE